MEQYQVSKTEKGLHIEGLPEAVKLIRLSGPKSRRLADLALHKSDLEFALEYLDAINQVPTEQYLVRRALWTSAIVHFMKCFGESKSRFRLKPKAVFKGDPGAFEPYEYIRSLRNKHLVHDENSFTQCLPGAALNRKGATDKIAKILCMSANADTLSQANYSNLHLLITRTLEWVEAEFDSLCDSLTFDLELKPYDELYAMEDVEYTRPEAEDVHTSRRASR